MRSWQSYCTLEESLLKAVRSLEADVYHLELKDAADISDELLEKRIKKYR
nr:hypothetical protein P5621_08755 [Bacillus subtilis]